MTFTLHQGDCLEVMAGMDPASIDAVVCDPPYGLEFMGKSWDKLDGGGGKASARAMQEWHEAWAVEALRVLKPSHYLLAFGGTRTWHRLACALEDAGFEIRDTLMWLYGCLSDDTDVLVDGEWVPYHKATVGRRALCYNQEDETYSWQPIRELLVYPYDDTAYRLHSDYTDQLVTRNHRCLVKRGGGYVFEYAEEAARQREARVPVLEDVQGLLATLRVPQRDAGEAEHDVLSRVCGHGDFSDTAHAQAAEHDVPRVRQADAQASEPPSASGDADVLQAVQRHSSRAGVGEARTQRPLRLDARERGQRPSEDERPEQPRMEGRRYYLSGARQLLRRAVCALSAEVRQHGAQGWLRDGAPTVCCADVGPVLVALGSGASPRPRPDEQRAVQPHAVRIEPCPQTVGAPRFTRASLARIEPTHYTGTVWCLRVPTGAFVARRNGKVFVTGNSGFPKGKACLKPAWEPIILARKPGPMRELGIEECRVAHQTVNGGSLADNPHLRDGIRGNHGDRTFGHSGDDYDLPATSPSGRWPANVILDEAAAGLVDEQSGWIPAGRFNAARSGLGTHGIYGKSAGCVQEERAMPDSGGASRFYYIAKGDPCDANTAGLSSCPLSGLDASALSDAATLAAREAQRCPTGSSATAAFTASCANCIRTPNPVLCAALLANIGITTTTASLLKSDGSALGATADCTSPASVARAADGSGPESGTRFLYSAKASRRERNAGCEGIEPRHPANINKMQGSEVYRNRCAVCDANLKFTTHEHCGQPTVRVKEAGHAQGNHHPTVKPLSLMQWLVRLVARPGDTILDPFTGSGTTGVACIEEGREFVGIERELDYVEISRRRLEAASAQLAIPLPTQDSPSVLRANDTCDTGSQDSLWRETASSDRG